MPPTVTVAAFVFGIVLILAALVGREVKIVSVELPALDRRTRIVIGGLGIVLLVFGLLDGQLPALKLPSRSASATAAPQPAASPAARGAQSTSATAPAAAAAGAAVLPCLADVAETDLVILPMDPNRRTDRKWSADQPRAGLLAMQFEDPGGIQGGVKFKTLASAAGVDIVGVFDAACQSVSTYANASNPSQAKDHPNNYESMRYQIGDFVLAADLAYGEGNDSVYVRAEQLAP